MRKRYLAAAGAAAVGAYFLSRRARPVRLPATGPRVVILGAGFGGLATARKLAGLAPGRLRVTIVDRHNYHLFTPMLYQASTCGVVPYDAAQPVRQWTGRHGVEFRQASVRAIDLANRKVMLDTGELDYEYLVIALGSTTNFFGNESARRHALPMKTLEDGIRIRNHVIDTLERAAVSSDPQERARLLTYVVVGGGATGVETAGALAGLLRTVLATDYPVLRRERWRVIVLESESKLLGHMGDEMAARALQESRAAGVEVRLKTKAKEVTAGAVTTDSGETIATTTTIWATGVSAPEILRDVGAQHGHGGSLAVDEFLRVQGDTHAFALGDNASFTDPRTGKHVPLLAAAAMQQGEVAAKNLLRAVRGARLRAFHYRDLGNVVSVGPRVGVARIAGRVIGGFAGWLAWRVVHLARISNLRNRLATALDWSVGYFYDFDTSRLQVGTSKPSRAA